MNQVALQPVPEVESTKREQLAAILALSLSMLDQAREGQWEEVETLDACRRKAVAACFREPASQAEAALVADYISRLLELNREITELTLAGRDQLSEEIRQLGTGRQATAAYGRHSP
jgi:hypothetical protein